MADLYPIVIPPLEHMHKSIKYTCAGEGLLKDGHPYDAHAEKLIPPKSAKAGAEPRLLDKKPAAYWKAQCAFRGLNQTGSINDLQLRMREAKKKMLPELKTAESELNKEFKKENKSSRDGTWNNLKTAEQKAKADPRKYLNGAFPKGATGRPSNLDIVVLKIAISDRSKVASAAEAMGLETVGVDAPWTGNKKPSPDRWLIIGRTRDAVWDQMRDIERHATRSKEEHSLEKPKPSAVKSAAKSKSTPKSVPLWTPHTISGPSMASKPSSKPAMKKKSGSSVTSQLKSEPLSYPRSTPYESSGPVPKAETYDFQPVPTSGPRTKQTARKSTAGGRYDDLNQRYPPPPPGGPPQKKKAWHPKVEMDLDEDEDEGNLTSNKPIENLWDVRGKWSISCPEIDDQWPCDSMNLELHLEQQNSKLQMYGTFDFGVLTGIMRFEKPIPVSKSEGNSYKRKREDDDHSAYVESCFHLGAKDKPTARRPTWQYRWRGEETGEGEIQFGSDEQIQSITFARDGKQLTMKGMLNVGFIGDCQFEGVKISDALEQSNGPILEWEDRSEDVYDDGGW